MATFISYVKYFLIRLCFLSTIFIIFLLIKSKLFLSCQKFKILSERRQVVFIIGQGRTGSTIIGSMFNQHKDVLYLFEPLRSIELHHGIENFRNKDYSNSTLYNRETQLFLTEIMGCHYDDVSKEYLKKFEKGRFRYFSKKLINPPFCKSEKKDCLDLTSLLMNKLCNETNLRIFVKELEFRIPNTDISFLQYLSKLREKENDVYIVHLVRDPRAFLLSMKKVGWYKEKHSIREKTEEVYIKSRCLETLKNIEYFIKNNAEQSRYFLKYTVLRYEDFATNPVTIAKRLHGFVGIKFSDPVKNYVYEKTNGKKQRNFDPYTSGSRNISAVKNNWRREGNLQFIMKVQNSCRKLMTILGYNMIRNIDDLKNFNKQLLSKPLIPEAVTIHE